MGRTFQFECPLCQYRASVSGGADHGLNCSVHTILCRDCRRLFDVLTRLRQNAEEAMAAFETANPIRTRLAEAVTIPPLRVMEGLSSVSSSRTGTAKAARVWKWIELKAACPVAGNHRIEFWSEPGRCPRCGNYLEKNGYPYRLWE